MNPSSTGAVDVIQESVKNSCANIILLKIPREFPSYGAKFQEGIESAEAPHSPYALQVYTRKNLRFFIHMAVIEKVFGWDQTHVIQVANPYSYTMK